jgi:hypothetical protein
LIWFDIDGVIRDLCTPAFGYDPPSWDHAVMKDGIESNIVGIIDRNLDILYNAPTFPYINVLKLAGGQRKVTLITHQQEHWKPCTNFWLWRNHIETIPIVFVSSMKDKLAHLKPGDLLVEDYPYYEDYSQIVLIDRAYNKNVETENRVTCESELGAALGIVTYKFI